VTTPSEKTDDPVDTTTKCNALQDKFAEAFLLGAQITIDPLTDTVLVTQDVNQTGKILNPQQLNTLQRQCERAYADMKAARGRATVTKTEAGHYIVETTFLRAEGPVKDHHHVYPFEV
jgi:hypothetical protein